MLDLAFMIAFSVMAVRIAKTIWRETGIFREFHQPKTLALLVFLFPLGPFLLLFGARYLSLLVAVILAVGCYLPALLSARKIAYAFERAGTDRVKRALGAAREAFGMALVGLVYVTVVFTIAITSIFIAN